jgi:hypothetical protein
MRPAGLVDDPGLQKLDERFALCGLLAASGEAQRKADKREEEYRPQR